MMHDLFPVRLFPSTRTIAQSDTSRDCATSPFAPSFLPLSFNLAAIVHFLFVPSATPYEQQAACPARSVHSLSNPFPQEVLR